MERKYAIIWHDANGWGASSGAGFQTVFKQVHKNGRGEALISMGSSEKFCIWTASAFPVGAEFLTLEEVLESPALTSALRSHLMSTEL